MNQHTLAGNPPLEINLRRSKQARRMSLRVSRLDGRVTLTFPESVPKELALDFAREKADWLRLQTRQAQGLCRVALGAVLPFQGVARTVLPGQGRRIQISDAIYVPGNPDTVGPRLLAHLKQVARFELAQASDRYAGRLGVPYSRLSIRDTRSRWGSCSAAKGLMYSWRLILAPSAVLNYVAAHEVAHLAEMNHSDRFWRQVTALYGDYTEARAWLRDHGHELHRYRFQD